MELVPLVIVGGVGIMLYNTFAYKEPQPEDNNQEGAVLPPPRFLWSDPANWTSAPVDYTYRPFNSYFGPDNDPRKAFLLPGGARIPSSGYYTDKPTNWEWSYPAVKGQATAPSYTYTNIKGTGEQQYVTSKTVFDN